MNAWKIAALIFFSCVVIGLTVVVTYFIIATKKRKIISQANILEHRVDIGELFVILEFIIKTETDLYESFLETNSTTDLSTLSNAEFVNIYQDISKNCLKSISRQFWELCELYINRELVETYVTQRVMSYLTDKLNEELDEDE